MRAPSKSAHDQRPSRVLRPTSVAPAVGGFRSMVSPLKSSVIVLRACGDRLHHIPVLGNLAMCNAKNIDHCKTRITRVEDHMDMRRHQIPVREHALYPV